MRGTPARSSLRWSGNDAPSASRPVGQSSGLPDRSPMLQFAPFGGAVAQLGERLVRNEKVRSSILLGSTNSTSAGIQ